MITLYGNPIPKKNSQSIYFNSASGKPFISQSARYQDYETDCLWQLSAFRKAQVPPAPLNVQCIYYRADHRRVDLVNLLEATDDILVRAGVIADDNYTVIAGHDGSRVYFDRERPRVEITITHLNQ